jgi:hypothetical protein
VVEVEVGDGVLVASLRPIEHVTEGLDDDTTSVLRAAAEPHRLDLPPMIDDARLAIGQEQAGEIR